MSEETSSLKQCAFCGAEGLSLRLCGACKVTKYCSQQHQKRHWKTHKEVCNQLRVSSEAETKENQGHNGSSFSLDSSLLDSVLENQIGPNGIGDPEPDLSTPIDSEIGIVGIDPSEGQRMRTQSLYQLDLTPDTHSIAEQLGADWLSNVTKYVLGDLNKYGFCVVDNFFGRERAARVLSEVIDLHAIGALSNGQVMSRNVREADTGMIRGDKMAWVSGSEPGCETIRRLVSIIDSVVAYASKHAEAGELNKYNITFRTRAMVACYPGRGSRYVKHIDNPNGDGRCVTAIYYVNESWEEKDGGVLRIFPSGMGNRVAQIEPILDRMLFFWSDRRNPHEVLPSRSTRYAITVWYLDQNERDRYKANIPAGN